MTTNWQRRARRRWRYWRLDLAVAAIGAFLLYALTLAIHGGGP